MNRRFSFQLRPGHRPFNKLFQHIVGDMNVSENLPEAFVQPFLSHVGKCAFAAITGATIVDVLPLLDLRCHGAIIVGTLSKG